MAQELKIAPALRERIESIAARSMRSASEVVADALENGYSLEWQEQYIAKVMAGIADADAGRFCSDADIERVWNKYRPS